MIKRSPLPPTAQLLLRRALALLLFALFLSMPSASAQGTDYLTRYVRQTGQYSNSGLSWEQAKANIQDAINDLRGYMVANGITSGGKVYVASGLYTPTESTEEAGGTTLNLSFKIYAGITVYGGFNSEAPEATPGDRIMVPYEGGSEITYSAVMARNAVGKNMKFKYATTLSGNLNSNRTSSLVWSEERQTFNATYPGNTYHVVTFATNGFNANGTAKGLTATAAINGFVIKHGFANNTDATERHHTAYGGGVYAVAGARIEFCEVNQCSASRSGGGVYCDGGGVVSHSYVHTNHAHGIGILYGQGGGVMLDRKGLVEYSIVSNNCGREGGGVALVDADDLGRNNTFNYQSTIKASVITNNTAASEGGGVFMQRGGVINGVSIYRNRCNGNGVIVNGLANGQASNVFAGEASRIYNSTIWGGTLGTADDNTDDIQYATSASEGKTRTSLYYVGISNHDEADWTYTYKKNVFGLSTDNTGSDTGLRYLSMKNPSEQAGVLDADHDDDAYFSYDWQPHYFSAVATAGVQLLDAPEQAGVTQQDGMLEYDFTMDYFTPTTTLGARTAELEEPTPTTTVPYQEDPAFTGTVYTLFVDPNRTTAITADLAGNYLKSGSSWDLPMNNLRRALGHFMQWKDTGDPRWNDANRYQILVKEGKLTPTNNYGSDRSRASSIWMSGNCAVRGGYAASLADKDVSVRNVMDHPTIISGDIIDEDYDHNASCLIQFGNVTGATLDGFHLTAGNAGSQVGMTGPNQYAAKIESVGGAIRVRNDKVLKYVNGDRTYVDPDVRLTSMHNVIRNCVISNCGALEGAAIHVSAYDGTTSTLSMENVIVHNNGTNFNAAGRVQTQAKYSAINAGDGRDHSIIHVGANCTLDMDHCDVLRNVGYGLYTAGGVANVTNSIFYANLDRETTETNDWPTKTSAQLMAPIVPDGGTINSSYNLLDAPNAKSSLWTAPSLGTNDRAVLDYVFDAESATYPRFANSTRNCGIVQSGGDVTYYGSQTDHMPSNMNPAVNAASYSGDHTTWGKDIVGTTRDFGGLPDIGAMENWDRNNNNHNQPAYGAVMYVRDYNTWNEDGSLRTEDASTTGRDGSSWEHAINGNGLYGGLNGLQYAVNTQSAKGLVNGKNSEVWVGAGIYKKDNEAGDKSCFMIRDKVDVYGAFPKTGNPTKAERQALVSQYVYVAKDNHGQDIYDYRDYETILQPKSTTIAAGVTRRVLGQPATHNPKVNATAAYSGATWDGFTLRYGVLDSKVLTQPDGGGRRGGGGAAIYKNVKLHNCIVTNNTCIWNAPETATDFRAGGVYMDGGTLDACYVINNLLTGWNNNNGEYKYGAAYGGGTYIYSGTVFNSVIANNRIYSSYSDGAGCFIENANFFNNTIVNNKAEGTNRACGGVAIWTDAARGGDQSVLNVYNSIIANNEGIKLGKIGDKNLAVQNGGKMHLLYCMTEDPTNKISGSNEITFENCQRATDFSSIFVIPGNYSDRTNNSFKDLNLRLLGSSPAINAGWGTPTTYDKNLGANITYDLSEFTDMDYAERVQDCTIDIGAYEYNGAYSITPDIETTYGTAYYYVTQNGRGTSSATDPANAACWQKLQKVLDAAGRYKYENPSMKVIVKVAAFPSANADPDHRSADGYTPLRSSEPTNEDARLYSILVPRGVEVWGGYTDDYTDVSDNGFAEDKRDITSHPTYFLGDYNVQGTTATAYHVVKFTDYVFDAEGNPYKNGDNLVGNSSYRTADGLPYSHSSLITLSSKTQERGVIDGIFVTGGKADAAGSAAAGINENQYGGACVIPDFGHVRNCILEGNSASEGGGAVYIQANGVISGTLLKNNTAAYGGAIYVEQLSELIASEQYPEEMAHIITCTVVKNNATTAGGGIWFYNNCRVNSSVFWGNSCSDQANVSGQTSSRFAGTTQTYRQYPFSYSAVERVRLAGTNNISVGSNPDDGVRFLDYIFYELDDYSVLCNVGMPNELYQTDYVGEYGANAEDFVFEPRISTETSSYIDIGARANNAISITTPTKPEQLLLRLYVSSPEDVDFDLVKKMRACGDATYSKIGSSFAYPMQHIEDALRYIRDARMSEAHVIGSDKPLKYFAANLPFEIVVSKGVFYPLSDIYGNYGYSISNTFLVPEGVTIVGGMGCERVSDEIYDEITDALHGGANALPWAVDDKRTQFYGQERRAKSFYNEYHYDLNYNVQHIGAKTVLSGIDENIEGGGEQLSNRRDQAPSRVPIYDGGSGMTGVTMLASPLDEMCLRRVMHDNNANGIYEPWEFKNQTILSGKVINATDIINGVYHVVTAIADEQYVGQRPMTDQSWKTARITATAEDVSAGIATSAGQMLTGGYNRLHPGTTDPEYMPTGAMSHEMGQPVEIDGLSIQEGNALIYSDKTVTDENSYDYYHGGAIIVDGNWCSEQHRDGKTVTDYKHQGTPQTVAYRDIPLCLRNCIFQNNKAGYGGAVSSNGSTQIFNCTFSQNVAMSGLDSNVAYLNQETGVQEYWSNEYPGCGGALYFTKTGTVVNTLFDNNEAQDPLYNGQLHNFRSLRNSVKSSTPSALYGGAGGCIFGGRHSSLQIINCDFVKNKATLFPAIYTQNPNTQDPALYNNHNIIANGYNEILSTIFWGNEATSSKPFAGTIINFAHRGAVKSYSTSTLSATFPNELPSSQSALDACSPTVWFSSYEQGTAQSPVYTYDLRNAPYTIGTYIPAVLHDYASVNLDGAADGHEQNCNIILSSRNGDLDGPCFSVPSITAGASGYMASADWSISRLNNIVDNGWGKMDQTIEQYYDEHMLPHYRANFSMTGDRYNSCGAYPAFHYDADELSVNDVMPFAERMPIGTERYMTYAQSAATSTEMYRISYDPNPTHEQTYIDMGVYEYVHTELKPMSENEVDILWVSTEENIDNGEPDGSCWEQPTSDMQRAIETLLASRNGHAKEIRITDGEYSPIYTMGDDKLLTFYINTSELNAKSEILESQKDQLATQYVKSLTITGGWSKNWKMTDASERNTEEYPAIMRSVPRSGVGSDKLNSVFRIEDARQWYGVKTSDSNNAKLSLAEDPTDATVIPITIEGLTFVNCNAIAADPAHLSTNPIGAAFYYGDQYAADHVVDDEGHVIYEGTLAGGPATGDLKLSFNRNIIMASGDPDNADHDNHDAPAAYIGKGGGEALVYNTLYHSNYGSPMVAHDTRIINCTFGLNHGILQLADATSTAIDGLPDEGGSADDGPMLSPMDPQRRRAAAHRTRYTFGSGSMVHNSIFWRNGLRGQSPTGTECVYPYDAATAVPGYGQQLSLTPAGGAALTMPQLLADPRFTYNALTDPTLFNDLPKDDPASLHEMPEQSVYEARQHNVGISLDNFDAIYGPNFANPALAALTQTEIEARDFHLQPSVRLMNTGSNDTYESVVGVNPTTHYTTIVTLSATTDAEGNPQKTIHNTTYTYYDATGKNMTTHQEERFFPYVLGDKEGTFEGFESDLSSAERVIAVTIDRGAYEFQNSLDRVIYVDPTHTDGNGTSWDKPYTSLQRAIDLVAVYYNAYAKEAYVFAKVGRMNENVIMRDGVRIYGSIPASYIQEAERHDEIRVNPTKSDDPTSELYKKWMEDDQKLAAYERQIVTDRAGLVRPIAEASRTIINGLQNTQAQYTGASLIDGVDIHGNSTEGLTAIKAPVVNLNSATGHFIIRNSVIRDNIVTGDANAAVPVVKVSNGTKALLYDVLLQNNRGGSASAVAELGNASYAVNVTNVAKGGAAVVGSTTNNTTGHGRIISSINWSLDAKACGTASAGGVTIDPAVEIPADHFVNCNTAAEGYPFAQYIAAQNALYTDYPLITYQLEENSPHIDRCSNLDYLNAPVALPVALQPFIDYAHDRDVLGNPRLIATTEAIVGPTRLGKALSTPQLVAEHVDRGCFETWRCGGEWTSLNPADDGTGQAPAPHTLVATTSTIATPVQYASGGDPVDYESTFPAYPHEGSVVYIMPAAQLVLGELTTSQTAPDGNLYKDADDNDVTAVANPLYQVGETGYLFAPAYLLVKEGASLFAQGNEVGAVYLATERYYRNGNDPLATDRSYNHLTALPYDYDYSRTQSVAYTTTGSNTLGLHGTNLNEAGLSTANVYDYAIADRSVWNYDFQTHNSDLWITRASTNTDSGHGVLLVPAIAPGSDALYRFTAAGDWSTDYVYTEAPDTWFKTLLLTQNDDVASTAGGADFTSREDMGWNCIGLPYLQAHYLTGDRSAIAGLDSELQAASAADFTSLTARAYPKSAGTDPGYVALDHYTPSAYQLHVPHTLWLYYNDTDTWAARNSWDAADDGAPYTGTSATDYLDDGHTYLMTGEACFTQTAVVGTDETVTFALPLWFAPAASPSQHRMPGLRLGGTVQTEPEPTAAYRVYSRGTTICIDGLTGTEHVTVHDAAGRTYDNTRGQRGLHTCSVAHGAYVVRIDRQAYKILVR